MGLDNPFMEFLESTTNVVDEKNAGELASDNAKSDNPYIRLYGSKKKSQFSKNIFEVFENEEESAQSCEKIEENLDTKNNRLSSKETLATNSTIELSLEREGIEGEVLEASISQTFVSDNGVLFP